MDAYWSARLGWLNQGDRTQRIKDYVDLVGKLGWQRQGSFLAAAVLSVFYFNPVVTIICYVGVLMPEILDVKLGARAKTWDGKDPAIANRLMKMITINTVLSAVAISAFVVSMALQEPTAGHFTPLFFLFSASLFAAMYNSQIISILMLRLSIYGVGFMIIAFLDLVRFHPKFSSTIWLNFFTVCFVMYFIIDISRKFYLNYQEQLEKMKLLEEEGERAKEAYEVKSQFVSTVSHELRTPLTSIKASLDLANAGMLGEVPEKLKRLLTIATRNSQRLADLVDDLLDLQKMEAGEMEFRFEKLNVNGLVTESVEAIAGYADKLNIHVITVLPAQELKIRGDHARLIQVMNNLLSNALKFSNEGRSVQVRVEKEGSHVRISVQDEGVGIPENAKDRVFGKFTQVDSSDIRKVGGTGLGLNITKQIVERQRGVIDYTSQLGVGSTFYVEFPLVQDSVEEPTEEEQRIANSA